MEATRHFNPANYLYDGMNVLEEVDNSGNVLARYTEGGMDEPFAELRSGTTSYYEQDGIDSVTSLTNSAGALANSYTFDSFGKLTAFTGTLINPFQCTGREFDSETGLHFYRARYYDQTMGRLLSEDPLEFAGDGPNFYAYTLNNPVNYVDPMGTSSQGPPPPPTPGPPGPAQLGGFIYNYPPPRTGPLGGAALAFHGALAGAPPGRDRVHAVGHLRLWIRERADHHTEHGHAAGRHDPSGRLERTGAGRAGASSGRDVVHAVGHL